MASSIALTVSLQRAACCPLYVINKVQPPRAGGRSVGPKPETHVMMVPETDVGPKSLNINAEKEQDPAKVGFKAAESSSSIRETIVRDSKGDNEAGSGLDTVNSSAPNCVFSDERWKNGTWDLNMFVRDGKIDWDGVIVAEARRRKFLEKYPETAKNQEPVIFRSSIIPWWAWMMRSHLPEAELINGRAAMVGFFMAYFVDALTGLDVVGQTGNLICKAGLLVTVMAVVFLRRTRDFDGLRQLAEEVTLYDKQWQSSWLKDQDAGGDSRKEI